MIYFVNKKNELVGFNKGNIHTLNDFFKFMERILETDCNETNNIKSLKVVINLHAARSVEYKMISK